MSLQLANHLRVEFPLQTRLRCRNGLPRFGVDDLVGRLPDARELQHRRSAARNGVWRLPNRHRLVHLASIEIRADGAQKIETDVRLLLLPGSFLATVLFCLNYITDGLRDAFDPNER